MSKQVLGVLCSGRGTDLQSIIDAIGRGEVDATIAVVLTDKPDAYVLTRAEKPASRPSALTASSSTAASRLRRP